MSDGVRIDRWLWAARFYRTRSLGKKALEAGRVYVGDVRAKPARQLSVGDLVTITRGADKRTLTVLKLSERRGSATIAQTLYEETPESIEIRRQQADQRALAKESHAAPPRRPDRRARREIQDLKRK